MRSTVTQANEYRDGAILTVDRSTDLGKSILSGTFAEHVVALPLPSLNTGVSIRSSFVPVRLQTYQSMKLFSFMKMLLSMVKRQDYILIYFPVLILLLKNMPHQQVMAVDSIFLVLVSLFFLMLSLRIRNHAADHLSGVDRLNPDLMNEPLMQGKVKVFELNQASYASLGLAIVCALPLIWQMPLILLFLLPATLLGIFVQFLHLSQFKSDKWGEFFLFCLFGPLYVSGLDLVFIQQIQAETIFIGFYIGICSVYLVDLRIFSNFLFMAEVHSENTLIAMGFDRAKTYLQFLMSVIAVTFIVEQFLFGSVVFGMISMVVGCCLFIWLSRHLRSCDSPMNSRTKNIKRDLAQFVYGLHLIWILFLIVKNF